MKALILSALVFASIANCHAQYVRFTKESNGTNQIVVPSGEVWQLVTFSLVSDNIGASSSTNTGSSIGTLNSTGGAIIGLEGSGNSNAWGGGVSVGSCFVGPTYLQVNSQSYYMLVFKKLSTGSTSALSATSVVVPSTATGDVDVKLEQSADNVTWTECLPGTYNSSTVKRFFRLRAVEK